MDSEEPGDARAAGAKARARLASGKNSGDRRSPVLISGRRVTPCTAAGRGLATRVLRARGGESPGRWNRGYARGSGSEPQGRSGGLRPARAAAGGERPGCRCDSGTAGQRSDPPRGRRRPPNSSAGSRGFPAAAWLGRCCLALPEAESGAWAPGPSAPGLGDLSGLGPGARRQKQGGWPAPSIPGAPTFLPRGREAGLPTGPRLRCPALA